jgi:hypothetical protein
VANTDIYRGFSIAFLLWFQAFVLVRIQPEGDFFINTMEQQESL